MPGTPDPVLGGTRVTWAAAGALAAGLVGVLALVPGSDPLPVALGYGVGYAAVCLGVWGGVRLWAGTSRSGILAILSGNRFGPLAVALLFVQGGLPAYLYVRWGLVGPTVGLVAATTVLLATFLMVGGESDPLVLYGALFGVGAVGALCVLALLEVGVGRIVP